MNLGYLQWKRHERDTCVHTGHRLVDCSCPHCTKGEEPEPRAHASED